MIEQKGGAERSVVLVAGSGRSGTSVLSGILQRLGYTVPRPEVQADESNPKGFAESRWVVDFHARLLRKARVETADGRPTAWTDAARVANDRVADELRTFLAEQLAENGHVIIKDPRIVWFLPLWRRVAGDLGVPPAFVTMLRHPAAVIDSKSRYYGSWRGDVSRAAGWVNTMVYTERATRDGLRGYIRYEDLLSDWPKEVAKLAEQLDLGVVSAATATQIRAADGFVDPTLRRSTSSWDDMRIPTALREQADHVWQLLSQLPDDADSDELARELDAARERYVSLYQDAEAIAQSSVRAARAGTPASAPARGEVVRQLRRRLPARVRRPLGALARRIRPR
jgi:hypothetical protein